MSKPKYPPAFLLIAAVAAWAGCDARPGPAALSSAMEDVLAARVVPKIRTFASKSPEWVANLDHCALEKLSVRMGDNPPRPWLSYCENPRPYPIRSYTVPELLEEAEQLKAKWIAEHGEVQWPSEDSEYMKRSRREWMARHNLEPMSIQQGAVVVGKMVKRARLGR